MTKPSQFYTGGAPTDPGRGAQRWAFPPERRPILVTGANRSGTTWVGTVLSLAPRTVLVNEPLKVKFRPGIFGKIIRKWFTYICVENECDYRSAFDNTIALKYGIRKQILNWQSDERPLTCIKTCSKWAIGRMLGSVPILKDPIALFSAEWLASQYGMGVVVLIRHPAAFVSSIKRYGHPPPFSDFLAQPLLMEHHLHDFREEIEEFVRGRFDIVDQGILAWKCYYSVVDKFRKRNPGWMFLRHEDLSMNPEVEFQRLYSNLNLKFTESVNSRLEYFVRSDEYSEIPLEKGHHFLRLDSRKNLFTWKDRLSTQEIDRVREGTENLSARFYGDSEW